MRFCASGIGPGFGYDHSERPTTAFFRRPQMDGCEPVPEGSSMLHVPSGPGSVGVARLNH